MTEKKYYNPQEAIDYLNEKLNPDPPLNLARLARLRREKRIKGERVGSAKTSMYTRRALDMATLTDIQDKRKTRYKTLDKLTTT